MPLLDQIRAQKLLELAECRFDSTLWFAEKKVLRSSASSLDVQRPAPDAPRPLIRPEFVRWLATDPDAAPHLDPKGIAIYGLTLQGDLDLRECRVGIPLYFVGCTIEGKIHLLFAETLTVFLRNSIVRGGIDGDGVHVNGPLSLRQSEFFGKVSFENARIEGDLECKGAHITVLPTPAQPGDEPEAPIAFSANGADIKGDLLLSEDFISTGTVRLLGAHVKNDLVAKGAKVLVKAVGPPPPPARPGKSKPEPPIALFADGIQVDGDVVLTHQFESTGEVRFLGAQIKGQVNCESARLLLAPFKDNRGYPILDDKENEIRPHAFSADGARIGDGVFLSDGFRATGMVRLPGANIGGQLRFRRCDIECVDCTNLTLGRDLLWFGIVNPTQAELNLTGARLRNLRDDWISWPRRGRLTLNRCVYDELTPEFPDPVAAKKPEKIRKVPIWHPKDRFHIRINWLNRQAHDPRVEPQPWMQFSSYLVSKGDVRRAKHVLYTLRRLQIAQWPWLLRRPAIAFAWLEEAPIRVVITILLTLALGTLIFWNAGASGALAPTEKEAYHAFTCGQPMPAAYPTLNPPIYTLENALPLVKLGQDDKWAPDRRFPSKNWSTNYWFLMWARWVLVIWGWFQAGVLGAALVSRFKS